MGNSKILRIPYTRHVSHAEVRRTTDCSPLSHLVTNRRLRLFGHIARSSHREDHHRALAACIWQVPPAWKWPTGRSSHSWLRAIEADLGPLNFGLANAWRKATTWDKWWHVVDTATLQWSTLWKKKKEGVLVRPKRTSSSKTVVIRLLKEYSRLFVHFAESAKRRNLWHHGCCDTGTTGASSVKERSGIDPDLRKRSLTERFVPTRALSFFRDRKKYFDHSSFSHVTPG